MTTPDIVLHQWCISSFCTKIRKVLAYKRLPYRIEEYGGLRALKAKSLSASGKLPVLDYDGERIADSTAIARFLDQRHPSPPLVPSSLDPHLVHLLEDWADESLSWFVVWSRVSDPNAFELTVAAACEGLPGYERKLFKLGKGSMRRNLVGQGLGRLPREQALANFRGHLAALEGRLERHPWLAGDALSIADIAAAAPLDEVVRTSPLASEIHALPALSAWRERCNFSAPDVASPAVASGRPIASA